MEPTPKTDAADHDASILGSMGYTQELMRRMSGFSNFAISFAIICILAGGITAFPQGLSAGGGASIGIGWPVGALFALVVALSMAQIASAYPTAGGLYHWSSILGNKGWGWATAWFNLLGLIFVVASVNFGVYDPFFKTFIAPLFHIDPDKLTFAHQTGFIVIVTMTQALLNHYRVHLTTRLTDLSGYLILAIAVVLTLGLLVSAHGPLDFSRLVTFRNFTGFEGGAWPHQGAVAAFLSGLLLTIYTIVGFDASAHTSEETHDAPRNVPRGMLRAVLWSSLFGYVMVCTFLLVLPDLEGGVKAGSGFFTILLGTLPGWLSVPLGVGIFLANYLCGLACLTSCSRMTYAFARDGGLPASAWLKKVNDYGTPGAAIWVCSVLAIAVTLYGDAFAVLSTGSAVFLYVSYVMPIAAGLNAEGRTWTRKGPFNLGKWSKPVALLAVLGGSVLVYVGCQPPNEKVLYVSLGLIGVMTLLWFGLGVRNRFAGPPDVRSASTTPEVVTTF
ncbi:amino acid permease [Paraburkholderia tropica]|uniref:amino acid permease n=1 Tax=Paraburkholderia tropica TaxID=92647 RepID=UPI002AB0DCF2|nr:amino acid permease [Paraburkholderia tropica]